MKKLFTTLFLACLFSVGYGQNDWDCIYDFDYNYVCDEDFIWIDTVSNPNNSWNIECSEASGDFLNSIGVNYSPYPVNDSSIFYFGHIAKEAWYCPHDIFFNAIYYSDCAINSEYGRIEFSPDNGSTWIDFFTDSIYDSFYTIMPDSFFLTGTSGWQLIEIDLTNINDAFPIGFDDTLLFRFTFISDSITSNDGQGLFFDNISLLEYNCPSVPEYDLNYFTSSLYPNPALNSATIEFENSTNTNFNLQVFDITGRAVIEQNIKTNRSQLSTQNLPPGIYQYRLLSEKERRQSFGKFLVE